MVQFIKSDSAPRGTLTGPAEVDPIFSEVIEALAEDVTEDGRSAVAAVLAYDDVPARVYADGRAELDADKHARRVRRLFGEAANALGYGIRFSGSDAETLSRRAPGCVMALGPQRLGW